MAKTSRNPDYNLSALDKATGERGKIGAAWLNTDGTINIKLNPYVVLTAGLNLHLTLFPWDGGPPATRAKPPIDVPAAKRKKAHNAFLDDDFLNDEFYDDEDDEKTKTPKP